MNYKQAERLVLKAAAKQGIPSTLSIREIMRVRQTIQRWLSVTSPDMLPSSNDLNKAMIAIDRIADQFKRVDSKVAGLLLKAYEDLWAAQNALRKPMPLDQRQQRVEGRLKEASWKLAQAHASAIDRR